MSDIDPYFDNTDHDHVSSAEFVRSFAKWRDSAQTRPVKITQHGRITHYLLSAREYDRLSKAQNNPAPEDLAFLELAEWLDDAIIAVNQIHDVAFCNRGAKAITGMKLPSEGSAPLWDLLPQLVGSLAEMQIGRTISSREPTSIDLPSPFNTDRWLRLRTFPLNELTILTFGDITEDVRRFRQADAKEAMLQAISTSNDVGYLRISVRGTIEQTDRSICEWLGIAEDRLKGVALIDVLTRDSRIAGRELIEQVLGGRDPQGCKLRLLTRDGELEVSASCAPLSGAMGTEGAVMILVQSQ